MKLIESQPRCELTWRQKCESMWWAMKAIKDAKKLANEIGWHVSEIDHVLLLACYCTPQQIDMLDAGTLKLITVTKIAIYRRDHPEQTWS